MPTYEYRCKACNHGFDIVQPFSEDALTTCPECREERLKKVFGNVGISFKGSGFYKTDSRSAGSFGSARDADKSDNDKPKSSDATKSSTGSSGGSDSTSKSSTTTSTDTKPKSSETKTPSTTSSTKAS